MANFVKCRFALIGNKEIDGLVKEIFSRLDADRKNHDKYADVSRVGRVFYGLKADQAVLGQAEIGAKWIHDDHDYDGLGFVAGWDPAMGFQDHLLTYASKIDPKVIVLMEYEDESPNFVGARYVVMKDGNIAEYESYLDLTTTSVVFDDDFEDALIENKATKEYVEVIKWEDLYSKINDCRLIAFDDLMNSNEWVSNTLESFTPEMQMNY